MDPLSVTASAIAIGQAASAIAGGVRALRLLSNGPREFAHLLDDISAFELVLEVTRASIAALQILGPRMPENTLVAVETLQRKLQDCTRDISEFAERMTAASKGFNDKSQHRIPRIRWPREKDNIENLRHRVQHLHLELSTCFAAVSTTQGHSSSWFLQLRD
ncbi:hypothetical protein QBC34DRAFT_150829 [Podospora aff. communis PSN243]|uniref:Fungal N-terminal domain-containing protein n=1 Tax=Podospora aff. communis PSN243 TaxID=3040156 RepID=A0AAV9GF38_9PEZI|nr:hypothetical protein QBC34DRAFT_150829 [Podospora aff. communis PSN243]